MEGHSGRDDNLAVVAKAGDFVPAGPARWDSNSNGVAAMVPLVVREAGLVDDALPRRVDVAEERAWLQGAADRVECVGDDCRNRLRTGGRVPDVREPSKRRVIAGDTAGEFKEDRVALGESRGAPGRMLLIEPRRGADEGTESWVGSAGDVSSRSDRRRPRRAHLSRPRWRRAPRAWLHPTRALPRA